MKIINATIDDNGDVIMEVDGVKGKSCTALTEPYEKNLGKVQERKLKPEYHQVAQQQVAQHKVKR